MILFQSVENSIHLSIQLEIDRPSRHADQKLPVLDLKMWVEKEEKGGKQQSENIVMHEFYSKGVSSKSVINTRSTLSWGSKRTILTQEVLRVLLNCSTRLPWDVTISHVNQMMLRLQYSGYDQKFSTEVVKSALNAYRNIQMRDANGETPMYRSRKWRRAQRVKEKQGGRETWYKRGGYDSVIFVPATPGSNLKRRCEDEVRHAGFRIKIVEQSDRNNP